MEYKISLKAARINANLTQEEVARVMHKSKGTIVLWENGKSKIKADDLMSLCDLYKAPISVISL